MKQLKCEMCGSTDLIKQDGVFVCQSCGMKYSVEEAKKMMIEGTVEVAGTVKVDSSTAIVRARQSLAHGELETAKEYFDRALEADPTNAEAWWGKFLIDFEVTDENALFKNPDLYLFRRIKNNSNYREAMQYAKEPFLARINRFQAEMENHSEIARKNEEKSCFKIERDTFYKENPLCLKGVTSAAEARYSNLVIPEGVKIIEAEAFKRYTFKRVTFPKSLWFIKGALSTVNESEHKYGIDEVCFPDLVTLCRTHRASGYPYNTFEKKTRVLIDGKELLTELEIPIEVTYIGEYAFSEFRKLKKVSIPNSVTSIGKGAFESCESLMDINIPNRVIEIEKNTFYGCRSLTDITIPNSVTKIGEQAFCSCESLKNITIPNSVTKIGEQAFSYSGLTRITISGRVKTIGRHTFFGCDKLTDVTICEGVETIEEDAFGNCENLRRIIIPKSVKSIAMREQIYDTYNYGQPKFRHSPFDECKNIEEVTIPRKFAGLFRSKLKKIFTHATKKIKFHLI